MSGGKGSVIATATDHVGIEKTSCLADTLSSVVKADDKGNGFHCGEQAHTSENGVRDLFTEHDLTNYQILKNVFPVDTCQLVEVAFRMVHADIDVSRRAKTVVEWSKKQLVTGRAIDIDIYLIHMAQA